MYCPSLDLSLLKIIQIKANKKQPIGTSHYHSLGHQQIPLSPPLFEIICFSGGSWEFCGCSLLAVCVIY